MKSSASTGAASWPLASILTIVFVILKLAHIIDWSWVWVLSPLWIGAAFVIGLLLLVLGISIVVAVCKK